MGKVGTDREKIREALAKLDYKGVLGPYTADKEGNLVHHMHTQVWKDGKWVLLMSETYPVGKVEAQDGAGGELRLPARSAGESHGIRQPSSRSSSRV